MRRLTLLLLLMAASAAAQNPGSRSAVRATAAPGPASSLLRLLREETKPEQAMKDVWTIWETGRWFTFPKFTNALVAKIAGVAPGAAPPAQSEKEECLRVLPSRFAGLTKEQQEFFRQSESRLARFQEMYASSFIGPSVVDDIKKTVRSPKDVPDRARWMENTAFKYEAAVNRITSNTDRFVSAWSRGFPKGAAAGTMMGQVGAWGQ